MRKLLTACTLIALLLNAAISAPPRRSLAEGEGPAFQCQIGQRIGNHPDSLCLHVAISVPYDNLTFVRAEDEGFHAMIEYTVTVFIDTIDLPLERLSRIEVPAESFRMTNARNKHAEQTELFTVPPGEHRVRVTLTDLESKTTSTWRGQISMSRGDSLLEVSDIYWVSENHSNREPSDSRVVESFLTTENEATARVDYYSGGTDQIRLHWTVIDANGDTIAYQISRTRPTGKVESSDYTVRVTGLTPQRYELRFEADGNGRFERRTKSFSIQLPGLPLSITDLSMAIRQVKYIASTEESRRLRNASSEDRLQLFREFWKKRDPDPETPENSLMQEYYYRIEYANDSFSTHRAGWETDRGRVYVMYGEPSQIERHPFESNSRPYEIWYYHHLNRRFVFVDRTGFGDYSLVGPHWQGY